MASISSLRFRPRSTPVKPPTGQKRLFLDQADGLLKTIDDAGNVELVGGSGAPFNAGATSAINADSGSLQKCTVAASSALTIANGSEGSRLELWVKNTSGSTVTITPSATPPSASTATTWDIEAGKTAIFLFRKLSGGWAWVSVSGNF